MKKTIAVLLIIVMLVMIVYIWVSRKDLDALMVEHGALRAREEATERDLDRERGKREELESKLTAEKSKIEKLERDILLAPNYNQGARVYRDSNQSIPSVILTNVLFSTETYDTDNCFDADTPDRLTCNTAGKYIVIANIRWAGIPGDYRAVFIQKNGEPIAQSKLQPNDTHTMHHVVATIIDLDVGDYVECIVWQQAGVSINIENHGIMAPSFMMQRIG